MEIQAFFYLFNNQEPVFDSEGMLWVDAVVEHDAIDVVDFMLDDDSIEALELEFLLFTLFVGVFNGDAGMADDITRDFAIH